ncbi:hypothetical protein [Noviherbaspirillum aerium]|uniref:hypothetical protein n=1 Tax=Noviherbaspirillum aerium TaxID=2588497 RepID=UPI00124C4059|nr:hypothetical protein [Noviherbaspirillum aerium]
MSIFIWSRNDNAGVQVTVEADARKGRTVMRVGPDTYTSLDALAAAFPELRDEQLRDTYCELCTQFHGEGRYQRIENPDAFRETYRALLAHRETGDGSPPAAADLAPFDLTEIAAPRISGDTLVFYVKDIRFGRPYRVEAPWSGKASAPVSFSLLPLSE